MNFTAMQLPRVAMTLVGALGLAAAVPANAATAVFDFGANNGLNTAANPDIYTLTVGSLTVNIKAYGGIYDTVNYANQVNATWSNAGLGAAGNGSGELNQNGGSLGGFINDPGEGLLLTFSQVVTLDQLGLSNFDGLDDVDIAWGNPLAGGTQLQDLNGIFFNGVMYPFNTNYSGTQFFIAARDDGFFDGAEGFRLDSVRVTYTPTAAPTAAVPEPATWAMMLLGFGVMGAAMRRRSRQTTVRYDFA